MILEFLTNQKVNNLRQQKWISKLLSYNYTTVYKKGFENTMADSSRMHNNSTHPSEVAYSWACSHEDKVRFGGEGGCQELQKSSNK